MSYVIGVDVGTTFTVAAVGRGGRVAAVELSGHGAAVPSVLFFAADGTVQVGDAAVRRAVLEPERVAREFKRRVGDPAPVIIGGSPYSADGLIARLLSWVVDAVAAREGGRPSRVALTHPANWGPYKRDLMRQAAQRAGIAPVSLLTEPEAAAACYAATERVEVGSTIAVYDLGGGTFDAAVLRKTATGFDDPRHAAGHRAARRHRLRRGGVCARPHHGRCGTGASWTRPTPPTWRPRCSCARSAWRPRRRCPPTPRPRSPCCCPARTPPCGSPGPSSRA